MKLKIMDRHATTLFLSKRIPVTSPTYLPAFLSLSLPLTHSLCYPHLIKHGTEAPAGKVMLMHRILGVHVCEIESDRLHPLLVLFKFVSSQRRWLTVVCLFACFLEHSSASGSIIQRTWMLSPVVSHLLAGRQPLKNPAPFFKLVAPTLCHHISSRDNSRLTPATTKSSQSPYSSYPHFLTFGIPSLVDHLMLKIADREHALSR